MTLPSVDRDELGRVVRKAWIAWAAEQPSPKPSWFVPFDELDAADQEADRMSLGPWREDQDGR